MHRYSRSLIGVITLIVSVISPLLYAADVKITAEIESIVVQHGDREVVVKRNQDPNNIISPVFAKTSRKCPPYCIQPIHSAPGVETIAELEVLDHLKQLNSDNASVIIDSRSANWFEKGTIPSAINIPWSKLDMDQGADSISIGEILQASLNAKNLGGLWDYSTAKTIILFCHGAWCDEASKSILSLVKYGYPANKIKWYRGGMQSWESFGLTTVMPFSKITTIENDLSQPPLSESE